MNWTAGSLFEAAKAAVLHELTLLSNMNNTLFLEKICRFCIHVASHITQVILHAY